MLYETFKQNNLTSSQSTYHHGCRKVMSYNSAVYYDNDTGKGHSSSTFSPCKKKKCSHSFSQASSTYVSVKTDY